MVFLQLFDRVTMELHSPRVSTNLKKLVWNSGSDRWLGNFYSDFCGFHKLSVSILSQFFSEILKICIRFSCKIIFLK